MYQTKRMVRWGDCDPAGIIYTPKAIDYALETIERKKEKGEAMAERFLKKLFMDSKLGLIR